MSKKEEFFKEKFKQALDSTYKVISEDFDNLSKKENRKHIEDYKISNLYFTPSDKPGINISQMPDEPSPLIM